MAPDCYSSKRHCFGKVNAYGGKPPPALRFLRANAAAYHIDPDHVFAAGDSSGGNYTAISLAAVKNLRGKDTFSMRR
jgi:hypothetical protein